MAAQRKVNAPVSKRRLRMPKGPHRLESAPPDSGMRTFVLLACGVVALLGLAVALPRWLPQPPPPWESYQKRMVEDPDQSRLLGRQVFVYRYPPAEVDLWERGIRSPGLGPDEFKAILDQAVALLRPTDAARVILAAAPARPELAEEWVPGINAALEGLSVSVPEERELRARLQALASPPAPAP